MIACTCGSPTPHVLGYSHTVDCPMYVGRRGNLAAGLDAKAHGMGNALLGTKEEWRAAFRLHAAALARSGKPFTSEDVVAGVGLPAGGVSKDRNNAVGAMMNGLARAHTIRKTGRRVLSRRESSHAAELVEWVGAAAGPPPSQPHDALAVAAVQSEAILARIRNLHAPHGIYDECGHNHEGDLFGPTEPGVRNVPEIGWVCEEGWLYDICRACCTSGDERDQTEDCADHHDHKSTGWLCATTTILDGGTVVLRRLPRGD